MEATPFPEDFPESRALIIRSHTRSQHRLRSLSPPPFLFWSPSLVSSLPVPLFVWPVPDSLACIKEVHISMGESWFHREFLVARRLAFNVLFYGAHIATFAYGWYSQVCTMFGERKEPLTDEGIAIKGIQHPLGWLELAQILGVDISRCWSRFGPRWRPYPRPHAPEYHPRHPPQAHLALPRR